MITQAAILQDGVIYTGKRHADVIHDMIVIHEVGYDFKSIQGFVTDKGEFLDRFDAKKHFIDAGQISVNPPLRDLLYSEDLY